MLCGSGFPKQNKFQLITMAIQVNHSPTEKLIEKTIKQMESLNIMMSRQDFILNAINFYVKDLKRTKVIK